MKIDKAKAIGPLLISLMLIGRSVCLAQDIEDDFVDLGAEYGTARLFPSMLPVTFLKITYFPYRRSTEQDKNQNGEELKFPETSTTRENTPWIILRKGADDESAAGTDILDQVERIDLQSIPGNAYFYFKPGAVHQGDHLQVGLITKDKQSGVIRRKNHSLDFQSLEELEIEDEPSSYTLGLDPRTVADQELIDGTTKTVHQLGLNLDIPSFGSRRLGNLYFHTENVLSTAKDDKSAQLDLRLGIERSLLGVWYAPANLEARYITNQASTHRSLLVSGGIRTFIPWGFAHRFEARPKNRENVAAQKEDLEIVHTGLLWNGLVKSPLAPELRINLQYEDRIEIDPSISEAHAAGEVGRVESLFELNPVYLLASGKPTPNDIVMTVRAKGWWFINEESLPAASARSFEKSFEADISIPLSRFLKNGLLSSTQSEDLAEKKLQIRYRSGANEANSFVRSSEWSLGFNILK